MSFGMVAFLVLVVILVIKAAVSVREHAQEQQDRILRAIRRAKGKLARTERFTVSQQVLNYGSTLMLGVDEVRRALCVADLSLANPAIRVISREQLLSVELVNDGNSVSRTSRADQLGGMVLGGVVLGGVGAVVGGLSSKQTTSQTLIAVGIRLIVADIVRPVIELNFVGGELSRDSLQAQHSLKSARHWYGLISVLIREGEREYASEHKHGRIAEGPSAADEIRKVAALRDDGLLTADEFQLQKTLILRRSQERE